MGQKKRAGSSVKTPSAASRPQGQPRLPSLTNCRGHKRQQANPIIQFIINARRMRGGAGGGGQGVLRSASNHPRKLTNNAGEEQPINNATKRRLKWALAHVRGWERQGRAGEGGTGFHIENDFIFNEKPSRDSTRNAGNAWQLWQLWQREHN